ncbi:hypothetical protein KSP35_06250 [Aquihabitans sp. G128]|uniref:type II secretion system F family protein n=1 Tax=Aquihabitans sp. G128 TaxID=2849779 RepID=UPI001C2237D4|nr:hypothetical protein [Aquihabitans sp. G128]QXC62398.1 hypothetical protein KSP35_06250 [Aquihabitans sp. G128]
MIALVLTASAAYGVHLLWTARANGWTGLAPSPAPTSRRTAAGAARRWLVQAGLDEVSVAEFGAVTAVVAVLGGLLTFSIFGSPAPALVAAIGGAAAPLAAYRNQRRRRRELAQEAWPRMIEEIRILTGAVGRSIPQALIEAGSRAPEELQSAFAASRREWAITTDFARTIAVLKDRLADPTADAACETLLVAHEVGGADLDSRLEALAQDRIADVQGRRDARAEQAGVRFARRFVLIVPFGMALAGMSVGNGRAAYRAPAAQLVVLVAMLLVLACWTWAGRIMALPEEERVFP